MMYDYLIVGAGLFGAVVAHELKKSGKSVIVVDKKSHIGGTVYTERVDGIDVHKYGAHIFRTDSKDVWNYINSFGEFRQYVHSPIALYKDQMYNLPFNMNTFRELWGVTTPQQAIEKIQSQRVECKDPKNLEEFVLSQVGTEIYEKLIKGYTEKQWGVECSKLPVSTMSRIPIRLTYDNNYYNKKPYQGIPIDGYTNLVHNMLKDVDYYLNTDGKQIVKDNLVAKQTIYTGCIDEYYDYLFGKLDYRTLRFETKTMSCSNYQGAPVVNHTSIDVPYTRTIEHKHFMGIDSADTIVTWEYPKKFEDNDEPYYPMLDETNKNLYDKYVQYSKVVRPDIVFCGKLGSYKYTDMEDTIKNALKLVITLWRK